MKKSLMLLAAQIFITGPGIAWSQDFPVRPVRLVVPYASGTGPEVLTRLLAESLSTKWKQAVIVEPKPGASGFLAINEVKNSKPEGYELLIAANGHMAINPSLYKKLPYDPQRDLVPIAMVYKTPHFLAVSATGPYQSVPALLAAARAKPGQLSYASSYVGSPAHLGSAEFEMMTDTRMIHAPFRDQNQAFVSIINGDVSWMFSTLASAAPLVKAQRIKLLAIAGPKRMPFAPDIPTMEEAGGPSGLDVTAWIGLFARSGTPADVVKKINADVNTLLTDPKIVERMRINGWEPAPSTPEDLAEQIVTDTKKYGELVRRTGATAD